MNLSVESFASFLISIDSSVDRANLFLIVVKASLLILIDLSVDRANLFLIVVKDKFT